MESRVNLQLVSWACRDQTWIMNRVLVATLQFNHSITKLLVYGLVLWFHMHSKSKNITGKLKCCCEEDYRQRAFTYEEKWHNPKWMWIQISFCWSSWKRWEMLIMLCFVLKNNYPNSQLVWLVTCWLWDSALVHKTNGSYFWFGARGTDVRIYTRGDNVVSFWLADCTVGEEEGNNGVDLYSWNCL